MSTASFDRARPADRRRIRRAARPGLSGGARSGKIVPMPMPKPDTARSAAEPYRIFGTYIDARDLGHLFRNDTGVITERGPDTVRGADISYYSYSPRSQGAIARPLPRHAARYGRRSPFAKRPLAEGARQGRRIPRRRNNRRRRPRRRPPPRPPLPRRTAPSILGAEADLTIPDLFGDDFRIKVARFVELARSTCVMERESLDSTGPTQTVPATPRSGLSGPRAAEPRSEAPVRSSDGQTPGPAHEVPGGERTGKRESLRSIDRIADDRMVDLGEVNPDLVGAPVSSRQVSSVAVPPNCSISS